MQGVGCYYILCKNTCVCEVNKLERRFYLVDAQVLPEVFLKVVRAKELLASGEARSISAATRAVDLSRSAFYKYKDCIFDSENDREVVTVMATLRDETGALQSLLAGISAAGASIVTINQSTPENGAALVAVTIRTDTMQMTPEELTEKLDKGLSLDLLKMVANNFDKKFLLAYTLKILLGDRIEYSDKRRLWLIADIMPQVFCAALYCCASILNAKEHGKETQDEDSNS